MREQRDIKKKIDISDEDLKKIIESVKKANKQCKKTNKGMKDFIEGG